jgi:hypothetical protein
MLSAATAATVAIASAATAVEGGIRAGGTVDTKGDGAARAERNAKADGGADLTRAEGDTEAKANGAAEAGGGDGAEAEGGGARDCGAADAKSNGAANVNGNDPALVGGNGAAKGAKGELAAHSAQTDRAAQAGGT